MIGIKWYSGSGLSWNDALLDIATILLTEVGDLKVRRSSLSYMEVGHSLS